MWAALLLGEQVTRATSLAALAVLASVVRHAAAQEPTTNAGGGVPSIVDRDVGQRRALPAPRTIP